MSLSRILKHKLATPVIGLTVVDLIFYSQTNAHNASTQVMFAGFVLFLATLYLYLHALLRFIRFYGVQIKKINRLAVYLTVTIGLLMALQSTGQLTVKDVLILMPLAYIGYMYSIYLRRRARQID